MEDYPLHLCISKRKIESGFSRMIEAAFAKMDKSYVCFDFEKIKKGNALKQNDVGGAAGCGRGYGDTGLAYVGLVIRNKCFKD